MAPASRRPFPSPRARAREFQPTRRLRLYGHLGDVPIGPSNRDHILDPRCLLRRACSKKRSLLVAWRFCRCAALRGAATRPRQRQSIAWPRTAGRAKGPAASSGTAVPLVPFVRRYGRALQRCGHRVPDTAREHAARRGVRRAHRRDRNPLRGRHQLRWQFLRAARHFHAAISLADLHQFGGYENPMTSLSFREGACAACHRDPASDTLVGHVYLLTDTSILNPPYQFPKGGCQ